MCMISTAIASVALHTNAILFAEACALQQRNTRVHINNTPTVTFQTHVFALRPSAIALQRSVTMSAAEDAENVVAVPADQQQPDNAWELSKENVLPLARGRNVALIHKALGPSAEPEAARAAKLAEIKRCAMLDWTRKQHNTAISYVRRKAVAPSFLL
jgi:hypothetical protein